MQINDPVFGTLEYNYGWSKNINIDFFGNNLEVSLLIDGDEDGEFDEEQYTAYQSFVENWAEIQKKLLQPILEYYQEKRHELGYDISFNENYPLVEVEDQLLKMILLEGVTIPYADIEEESRDVGLLFKCTWDIENGLGTRLLDEEIVEVGYQDIVI